MMVTARRHNFKNTQHRKKKKRIPNTEQIRGFQPRRTVVWRKRPTVLQQAELTQIS